MKNGKSKPITHLRDLTADPKNARAHNPRNVGLIETALGEVGAARSIVVDENGMVLAGNATIEAAARVGIEKVQVVDADGETVIAVRRSGLTARQKKRLALLDNAPNMPQANPKYWDDEVIAELAARERDILDGIFYQSDLEALGVITPDFQPGSADEQGRLDQKKPVTCPECGHTFEPK